VEHALLALGAMRAGIPYAPVSIPYALASQDYGKLRHAFGLLTPGMVYVPKLAPYRRALAAVAPALPVLTPQGDDHTLDWQQALATVPGPALEAAEAALSPDTVAKFLFTSGSTGLPKAVINTQRMLCCNQAMIAESLAFLQDEPPVLVDWMPWNHTAGGNHNFGIAIYNGGTLYIDGGKPTPAGIAETVRNLSEISPTWYSNVPKGYEMLVERMAGNETFTRSFFARLNQIQYAGANLARHVWDGLMQHARETTGQRIMIVTGYGSTETAPFASTTTWEVQRPGEIGLPAAGLSFKLVPNGQKLELRLKGPSITPGYWRMPEQSAAAFDEEGYYCIGDALKFVDDADVSRGLLFDGRVSEDFKLSTGTWVNFASMRSGLVHACAPLVRDAVLTGLDRNYIGTLLVLDLDAAARVAGRPGTHEAELARDPAVRTRLTGHLRRFAAQATGSSNRVVRAMILDSAPDIDRGEITDKGSINQRAVLQVRAAMVEQLYAEPLQPGVIDCGAPA
nr:feruloyl-CoA synthase [Thiolinea sp.]